MKDMPKLVLGQGRSLCTHLVRIKHKVGMNCFPGTLIKCDHLAVFDSFVMFYKNHGKTEIWCTRHLLVKHALFSIHSVRRWLCTQGGHLHWEMVQECAMVMTSFFQPSRCSLGWHQFTINGC